MQVLVITQEASVLTLGNISLDGSKIHADASTSKAVSYENLPKLEIRLRAEVEELLALAEQADQADLPPLTQCATLFRYFWTILPLLCLKLYFMFSMFWMQ